MSGGVAVFPSSFFHFPDIAAMYYSSFHFLFQYPYVTPICYSSLLFIFHYPNGVLGMVQ